MARYECRVITLHRGLLGDPLSADRLATVDQFSPSVRDGLPITFERPAQ